MSSSIATECQFLLLEENTVTGNYDVALLASERSKRDTLSRSSMENVIRIYIYIYI